MSRAKPRGVSAASQSVDRGATGAHEYARPFAVRVSRHMSRLSAYLSRGGSRRPQHDELANGRFLPPSCRTQSQTHRP